MSEDGWTHVTSKRRRRRQPATRTHKMDYNSPDPDATVPILLSQFTKCQAKWKESTHYHSLRRLVTHSIDRSTVPIDKAVCLGIGQINTINLENRHRSLTQLAVFFTIVDSLKHNAEHSIHMIAQEPDFTPLDKAFLGPLGFTILDCDEQLSWSDKSTIGPAAQQFGMTAFVADFFMNHSLATLQQLLCSDTQFVLSAGVGFFESPSFLDKEVAADVDNMKRQVTSSYTWTDVSTFDGHHPCSLYDTMPINSLRFMASIADGNESVERAAL